MDIGDLKRDSGKISSGIWVRDIPEMGDIEVKVRGMSSPLVVSARAAKERGTPKNHRNRDGSLKTGAAIKIMRVLLSEVVLLDIKGLTQSGKKVDIDKAKALILDPDYEALADAVFWAASAVDRGVAEDTDAAVKN